MTKCLKDDERSERKTGMEAGIEILRRCDGIVVGERFGISEGMKKEIEYAKEMNMKIERMS